MWPVCHGRQRQQRTVKIEEKEGEKRREGGGGDEGMWTFGRPFIRVSGRTTHWHQWSL